MKKTNRSLQRHVFFLFYDFYFWFFAFFIESENKKIFFLFVFYEENQSPFILVYPTLEGTNVSWERFCIFSWESPCLRFSVGSSFVISPLEPSLGSDRGSRWGFPRSVFRWGRLMDKSIKRWPCIPSLIPTYYTRVLEICLLPSCWECRFFLSQFSGLLFLFFFFGNLFLWSLGVFLFSS